MAVGRLSLAKATGPLLRSQFTLNSIIVPIASSEDENSPITSFLGDWDVIGKRMVFFEGSAYQF